MTEETKPAKKDIDWEAIEIAYRAGVDSTRTIAEAHGISHTLINRKAKAESWVRDLSHKIRAKADELVSKDAVSSQVSMETKAAEKEVIEANAELQASVRREQRKDISRGRALAMKLMGELESQTDQPELFEKLAELMIDTADEDSKASTDRAYKLQQAFDKVMSAPGRIDAMKKLAETLKTLIALEREAFGIDERKSGDMPTVFNMTM